jgi:hypothetical protein
MFFAQRYSSIDLNLFKDISKTLPKNLVFVEKNKHYSHEQCLLSE